MEVLCLMFSIVYTSAISLALSLLLLFHTLLTRLRSPPANALYAAADDDDDSVSLYEGTVWHERRRPVHHSFSYGVRYALFDLDHALHVPPDHLSAEEARRVAGISGPVFLLTIPPSVGYVQNPLSLYYCYDWEGSFRKLKKCIAEVTNTPWGERVTFVFNPGSDLVAKPLHVSPFMDMLGNWRIKANAPGDSLSVYISVQHPELGDYFVATLKAKRLSSSLLHDHATFFWLMPHKVAWWIYWHAFKLWWQNVRFIQHPRYANPMYRKEAALRDQKLQCCKAGGWDNDNPTQTEGHHPGNSAERNYGIHCFRWRNAQWPWS